LFARVDAGFLGSSALRFYNRCAEPYPKHCISKHPLPAALYLVPSRRREDKIRKLCAKAVAAGNSDFQEAISELQAALHEHAQELRKTLIEQLAGRPDRRVRSEGE
jgi:hypothetical protein